MIFSISIPAAINSSRTDFKCIQTQAFVISSFLNFSKTLFTLTLCPETNSFFIKDLIYDSLLEKYEDVKGIKLIEKKIVKEKYNLIKAIKETYDAIRGGCSSVLIHLATGG